MSDGPADSTIRCSIGIVRPPSLEIVFVVRTAEQNDPVPLKGAGIQELYVRHLLFVSRCDIMLKLSQWTFGDISFKLSNLAQQICRPKFGGVDRGRFLHPFLLKKKEGVLGYIRRPSLITRH